MKYLLDTDVIIYHLRGTHYIDEKYRKAGYSMSIITYGELRYGTEKSFRHNAPAQLKQILEDIKLPIIPLNEEIMDIFAETRVHLEKKGQRIDNFDLLIASTAIKYNLILHTGNKKHFERIRGLQLT